MIKMVEWLEMRGVTVVLGRDFSRSYKPLVSYKSF